MKKNPIAPLLEELDELPFPDREIFNANELVHESSGRLPILASRGCPYNCTYCSNNSLRMIASGGYVRSRNPQNIVREIDYVHKLYPWQKTIHLEIESIALNKKFLCFKT